MLAEQIQKGPNEKNTGCREASTRTALQWRIRRCDPHTIWRETAWDKAWQRESTAEPWARECLLMLFILSDVINTRLSSVKVSHTDAALSEA